MQATVMVRYSLLASVVLAAGCSSNWGRRPVDQPTPIHSGDPVWIWTKRGVEKWRAVVITQDSVSGIPFETSRKCVVCRRSTPRVQVDSMKHGYRTLAQNVTEVVSVPTLLLVGELALSCLLR